MKKYFLLFSVLLSFPAQAAERAFMPIAPQPRQASKQVIAPSVKFFPLTQERSFAPLPLARPAQLAKKDSVAQGNNGQEVGKNSAMTEKQARQILELYADNK